jgi:hypothetical protein
MVRIANAAYEGRSERYDDASGKDEARLAFAWAQAVTKLWEGEWEYPTDRRPRTLVAGLPKATNLALRAAKPKDHGSVLLARAAGHLLKAEFYLAEELVRAVEQNGFYSALFDASVPVRVWGYRLGPWQDAGEYLNLRAKPPRRGYYAPSVSLTTTSQVRRWEKTGKVGAVRDCGRLYLWLPSGKPHRTLLCYGPDTAEELIRAHFNKGKWPKL